MKPYITRTDDTQLASGQLLFETAAELQALVWAGVSNNAQMIDLIVRTLSWMTGSVLRAISDAVRDYEVGDVKPSPRTENIEHWKRYIAALVAYHAFSLQWQSASAIATNATEFREAANEVLPDLIRQYQTYGNMHSKHCVTSEEMFSSISLFPLSHV